MSLLMMITDVAGVSTLGLFLLVVNLVKEAKKKRFQRKEQAVLQQVFAHGGRVTPLQIAANIDRSFEEVKATLDRLCDSGFGQFEMTESGTLALCRSADMDYGKFTEMVRVFPECEYIHH